MMSANPNFIQVELQKTLRDSQRKDEELNASRQVLEEQEQELLDYRDELSQTERENRLLRKGMGMLHDEAEATRFVIGWEVCYLSSHWLPENRAKMFG